MKKSVQIDAQTRNDHEVLLNERARCLDFWKSSRNKPETIGLMNDETHVHYDPKSERLSDLLQKRGTK